MSNIFVIVYQDVKYNVNYPRQFYYNGAADITFLKPPQLFEFAPSFIGCYSPPLYASTRLYLSADQSTSGPPPPPLVLMYRWFIDREPRKARSGSK